MNTITFEGSFGKLFLIEAVTDAPTSATYYKGVHLEKIGMQFPEGEPISYISWRDSISDVVYDVYEESKNYHGSSNHFALDYMGRMKNIKMVEMGDVSRYSRYSVTRVEDDDLPF